VEFSVKTLVVYYTRTGNSKFAAETIAAELGGDIDEVVDLKKRQGRLAYMSCGRDAMSGKETEIAPTTRNPADYDLIVIVQPVWAWSPTPAIRTYVNRNDLAGKKVALFFEGSNLRQAVEKTKALMTNSTFVGELALDEPLKNKEEAEKKIVEWCNKLKTA
jgi:flavodoxin